MREESTDSTCWLRSESAGHVEAFTEGGESQRGYARRSGVPRTTLQHWLARKESLDADPAVVAFFESSAGVAFLHRLMVASFFCFDFITSSGLRVQQRFLELSGLSKFMASSYGTCQRASTAMEEAIRSFAAAQREALRARMAPKHITVCQDETFHPEVCLVAIEPVSDFILLESYSEKRDGASWDAAMAQALKSLPVKVIQATSDEGKGLLAHAKSGLGAHHGPDLFHVQHELSRATAARLASQVRQAEAAVAGATASLGNEKQAQSDWAQAAHGPGRPPDFQARVATAEATLKNEVRTRDDALNRQELAREAIRGVGADYHLVDLQTGAVKSAEQVYRELRKRFAQVEAVASGAQLPERCHQGIAKARRVLHALVWTLAFCLRQIAQRLDEERLAPEVRQVVQEKLLPAAYLRRAAAKATSAETRKLLLQKAESLAQEGGMSPLLHVFTPEQRTHLDHVVRDCADLFQRSSSCVEGRNGQLALRHHSLHRLSKERLEALTAVHNYFVTRPDGTTAAQRFFGHEPDDLIGYLLDHLDLPSRPAKKRPRFPKGQILLN